MNELTVPRPDRKTPSRPRTRHSAQSPAEALSPSRHIAEPASGQAWARAYGARLLTTDIAIIVGAVGVAFFARFGFVHIEQIPTSPTAHYAILSLAVAIGWAGALSAFRTRDLKVVGIGAAEYRRVVNASTTIFGLAAIVFIAAEVDTARWFFTVAFPLGLIALLISRWLWRKWLFTQRKFGHYLSRVVVVGRRGDVEKVVRQMNASSGAVYSVIGAVLDKNDDRADNGVLRNLVVKRDFDRITDYAAELGADGIVVAGHPHSDDFIRDLAWQLEGKSVELILATSLANVAGPRIHFRPVDGLPLLHVEIPQFEGGKHLLKRALDVTVSAAALLFLAPFFVIIALLVRSDSPGNAFFTQQRVGRNGRTFDIVKFRSMVSNAPELLADLTELSEGNGVLFKMKNDPRVTRLGRFLRKYSIDELPQLWNVFTGDMSLVGPRPPLPSEVLGYEDHVRRRLYIKPGLTGMWQVNGRSALSWEDSVRLDLYYVENWSVVGDLMIMWRTVRVVVQPDGAY